MSREKGKIKEKSISSQNYGSLPREHVAGIPYPYVREGYNDRLIVKTKLKCDKRIFQVIAEVNVENVIRMVIYREFALSLCLSVFNCV